MQKIIMKLGFLVCLTFCMLALSACSDSQGQKGSGDTDASASPSPEEGKIVSIIDFNDFGRDATKFSEIKYKRPDTEELLSTFSIAKKNIENNALSFEEQILAVKQADALYLEFLTMYSLTVLATSENSGDEESREEHKLLSEQYPKAIRAAEELMVAAARSQNAKRFEEECFGKGLIDRYADGGKYTEKIISIMEEEARLEADYSALSRSTVKFSYGGAVATFEQHKERLRARYGEKSFMYKRGMAICDKEYQKQYKALSEEIFISLVRARRILADEYGYASYMTYAYENIYHDYSPEQAESFIDDVTRYVIPVYANIQGTVFGDYFKSTDAKGISRSSLINSIYEVYRDSVEELGDIFAYMLGRELYSIQYSRDSRAGGAFTTYLHSYDAPYVFVSLDGAVTDYMTVSHEFGHFADYLINRGESASLDLMEVSSQGLELLTLSLLKDKLAEEDYRYLFYSEMRECLLTIIYQAFYAKVEHEIYKLSFEDITRNRLDEIVKNAAKQMGLSADGLSDVLINHLFLYPFYVQSYCPSMAAALDLYFMEEEDSGAGFEAYIKLVNREESLTFEEAIIDAGLDSPFESGRLMEVADNIYYAVNGYHYYDAYENTEKAA